jgi:hypothetical protein
MSTPISTPIPAGWYPDPAGSFQQRWWTGASWTNDFAQYRPTLVHAAPVSQVVQGLPAQQQPMPSASYMAQQAAATTASTAQVNGQQTTGYGPTQTLTRDQPGVVEPALPYRLPDADQPPQTVVAQPNAGSATLVPVASAFRQTTAASDYSASYEPFSSTSQVRRGVRVQPERRYTVSSMLLALLPLAVGAAAYALATLMPALYTTFAQVLLLVVFLLVSVGLAAMDRHALYNDGHDSLASPAFALLTPLGYLIARVVSVTRETGRNALAPLILLLVVIAAIGAALVFVSGLLSVLLTTSGLY